MRLIDLVTRVAVPAPWAEGEQIPWDDPDFGARMLREHLSQEHDAASRRAEGIDAAVSWVHAELLGARPGRVLDLGCGPGLYASRLARLGHDVVGVDFSPVAVGYARQNARADGRTCRYVLGDLRKAEYGADFDVVMQIYGEMNVFRPEDAAVILRKAFASLRPGGRLVVELQRPEAVERNARVPPTWRLHPAGGLFSDRPYLQLESAFWHAESRVGTRRMDIVDATTGEVACYALSTQAYSEEGFRDVLAGCGYAAVEFWDVCSGLSRGEDDFVTVTATRPARP